MLSVIITAHNEGDELRRTVDSIQSSTHNESEILVIDEASTDDSCDGLERDGVRVIRHQRRIGVAFSRDHGVHLASGDVVAFVDGHQRFSPGCLDRCAEAARKQTAVVWPDVRGFHRRSRLTHGASFRLCPRRNYFSASWRNSRPFGRLSRISSLRAPGYVVPRSVYDRIRWIPELRGWGGSEACLSLKAFFLDVPILHLCGPVARHLFKQAFQYDVTSQEVWRNQALIARVCFDERTWFEHWLPSVFDGHLSDSACEDLELDSVRQQQQQFQKQRVRTDREFWTDLLRTAEPGSLRQTSVGWRRDFRLPLQRP